MSPDNPDCSMKAAARVDSYRGFVFASLAAQGPTLSEFLGEAKIAFDDMCDRSAEGAVDFVPVCHRLIQHSYWKFFLENQLDALHPSVTHQSTGAAAGRVERQIKESGESPPLYYHYLSTFALVASSLMGFRTNESTSRAATVFSKDTWGLRPDDPDTKEYVESMYKGLRRDSGRGNWGAAFTMC